MRVYSEIKCYVTTMKNFECKICQKKKKLLKPFVVIVMPNRSMVKAWIDHEYISMNTFQNS